MSSRVFRLRVPAQASSLGCLRSFLAAALDAMPGAFVDCVVLAVDEACANVVRHRHPDMGCELDVTFELTDDRFRCRIGSFCTRSDLPALEPRAVRRAEGGLGTHFIRCAMDRVDYEPDPERPGALVLVLEKRLPEEPRP